MDKKSTVLLTVIAVATLLVAVVGSTFAFFAIQETNTAKVSEPAQSPTESLKLDLNKIQADGDYPTPMFIGDPNMPELEATNGPINCSSTISVLANRPRFDEDV